ncbi:glycosyltransferase [Flavobacterium sp. ov086]|uniref:glycosyltransferase n=1 Tax=Flavobacterium sp. ov086 TaxID=1761785 RepID=UPI000B631BFC|nr:glycosyltransferase [Flavobacterium sp. ov086]SNR73244.1 Glycosyltransferase involved in cell wall bisynthesis [Flavobacterium sp. ov086]
MINSKIKIAIVSTSLATGGAERFASLLSKMLENDLVEVHNVIINDVVDYNYHGKLYNLGKLSEHRFSLYKKIKKGFLLHQYLKQNKIELIIDNRPRNHFLREIISNLIYRKRKKWFVIHSFNLKNYFPRPCFLSKKIYEKADKLICVSKEIEDLVVEKFNFSNTVTIYNPFEISELEITNEVSESEKYILFFGRFNEKVKNFSLMLEAFLKSEIYNSGYSLYLLGEGPDLNFIQKKIRDLGLEKFVKIIPAKQNPYKYISKAKYTVLTSHFEGFPMSIIESLAIGIPVVSVNCKSGPKEIIQSEFNGLLVENYNSTLLAEAFKRMIYDEDFYRFCKNNTAKSVTHLSLESVGEQWKKLIFSNKI